MSLESKIEHANKLYEAGDLEAAKKICNTILKKNKKHVQAYSVLGMIALSENKFKRANDCFLKASVKIEHNPTLYNNLGISYLKLDDIENAKTCFEKALDRDPSSDVALMNLAVIYEKEKDYTQALAYAKKAVVYGDENPYSHQVYGKMLCYVGDLDESLKMLNRAYQLAPDSGAIIKDLAEAHMRFHQYDSALNLIEKIQNIMVSDLAEVLLDKVTMLYLKGDFEVARTWNNQVPIAHPEVKLHPSYMNFLSYSVCFHEALNYYEGNQSEYDLESGEPIYFIGESHCLPPHMTRVKVDGSDCKIQSKLVRGVKIWHVINDKPSEYGSAFKYVLNSIPENSKLIVGIGEIDCRINEGIFKNYLNKGMSYEKNIDNMLGKYIEVIRRSTEEKACTLYVYGVPAPRKFPLEEYSDVDINEFCSMVAFFNQKLSQLCRDNGIPFLDVYQLTVDKETGLSNEEHHLDAYHMKPNVVGLLLKSL
jgi:tetratricopeptide (TPR) repeat protein